MLGSLILYLEGTRIVMFQLSGFYYKPMNTPTKRYCYYGYGSKSDYYS